MGLYRSHYTKEVGEKQTEKENVVIGRYTRQSVRRLIHDQWLRVSLMERT